MVNLIPKINQESWVVRALYWHADPAMTIQEQHLENKLRLINRPQGRKTKYMCCRVFRISDTNMLFLEDAKEPSIMHHY